MGFVNISTEYIPSPSDPAPPKAAPSIQKPIQVKDQKPVAQDNKGNIAGDKKPTQMKVEESKKAQVANSQKQDIKAPNQAAAQKLESQTAPKE